MKKLLLVAIVSIFAFAASAADTTAVTVQVGAGFKTAPITVVDQVTGATLSATVSNIVIQNDHPELITLTTTGTATIKATGVAAGSGYALVSCKVSYVDPGDGLSKYEDKFVVVSYTVTNPPPHGAKLSLTFTE